jgi:ribosomal protein S18 acetylase RimI-like enzyme
MPIIVRRAGPADAAVVAEFNRLLAAETEALALDAAVLRAGVEAGLADEHKALYFVAEEDGDVVGQLMLTREWSDWRNGWMWWIQSVYVRADARRRGAFRALYQQVHEAATADPGVIGLRLYVEHANGRARQTYERLGMRRTGYLVFERCPL